MTTPVAGVSRSRPSPYAVRVLVGIAVVVVLAASMLATGFGLYATEAVALVVGVLVAGLAFFTAVLGDPTAGESWWPRLVQTLAVVGFAASLLSVLFEIVAVAGVGLGGVGNATAREVVLRGGDYQSALARCAGLCVVAYAFTTHRSRALIRTTLLSGGVITCASFVLMGHVRSHHPVALVATLALSHVLAVAAWFGGLFALATLLRRSRADRLRQAHALTCFAGLMTGVIAMLLAGGIGLALLYLPSWHALFATAYGQVLLIKVGLVAGVLVVSASNHRRIVPAATEGNPAALAVLRTNVTVEQIVLVAVLIITEVLMRQSPVT
jgi:putative copper export protein